MHHKAYSVLRSALASLALASAFAAPALAQEPNKLCPIMIKDEADPEEKTTYQGKDIYFCCGPCAKQFSKEPDYYVKVFQAMKSVPAVQDLKVPGDIQLLEQRFCPFSTERLIGPACPSVEYKGVKIYFSKPAHLKTWNANPDAHAKEAFDKGLLPQLKGKL